MSCDHTERCIRVYELGYMRHTSGIDSSELALILSDDGMYKYLVYLRDEKGWRFNTEGLTRALNEYLARIEQDESQRDLSARIRYVLDMIAARTAEAGTLLDKDMIPVQGLLHYDLTLTLALKQIRIDSKIESTLFYSVLYDEQIGEAVRRFWDEHGYMTSEMFATIISTAQTSHTGKRTDAQRIATRVLKQTEEYMMRHDLYISRKKQFNFLSVYGIRLAARIVLLTTDEIYAALCEANRGKAMSSPDDVVACVEKADADVMSEDQALHPEYRHSEVLETLDECKSAAGRWPERQKIFARREAHRKA